MKAILSEFFHPTKVSKNSILKCFARYWPPFFVKPKNVANDTQNTPPEPPKQNNRQAGFADQAPFNMLKSSFRKDRINTINQTNLNKSDDSAAQIIVAGQRCQTAVA